MFAREEMSEAPFVLAGASWCGFTKKAEASLDRQDQPLVMGRPLNDWIARLNCAGEDEGHIACLHAKKNGFPQLLSCSQDERGGSCVRVHHGYAEAPVYANAITKFLANARAEKGA